MKAKERAKDFIGSHPQPSNSDEFAMALKAVSDDITAGMPASFHGWKSAIEQFRAFAMAVNKHYGQHVIEPMGIKKQILYIIKKEGIAVPKIVLDRIWAIR